MYLLDDAAEDVEHRNLQDDVDDPRQPGRQRPIKPVEAGQPERQQPHDKENEQKEGLNHLETQLTKLGWPY